MRSDVSQDLELVVSGPKDKHLRKAFEGRLRTWRIKNIRTVEIERGSKWTTCRTTPIDLFVVLCPPEKSVVRSVVECLKSLNPQPEQIPVMRFFAKFWGSKKRDSVRRAGIWLSTSAGHSIPTNLEPDDVAERILRTADRKTSVPQASDKEERWTMLSVAACCGGQGVDEFNKRVEQGMPYSKAALEAMNNSNPSEGFEKAKFAF